MIMIQSSLVHYTYTYSKYITFQMYVHSVQYSTLYKVVQGHLVSLEHQVRAYQLRIQTPNRPQILDFGILWLATFNLFTFIQVRSFLNHSPCKKMCIQVLGEWYTKTESHIFINN